MRSRFGVFLLPDGPAPSRSCRMPSGTARKPERYGGRFPPLVPIGAPEFDRFPTRADAAQKGLDGRLLYLENRIRLIPKAPDPMAARGILGSQRNCNVGGRRIEDHNIAGKRFRRVRVSGIEYVLLSSPQLSFHRVP